MSKDKHGHDYDTLLGIQAGHLALWRPKLDALVYHDVASYVRATNKPAADESQTHRVYRGQDLVELIKAHPDIPPPYVPMPTNDASDLV